MRLDSERASALQIPTPMLMLTTGYV